MSGIRLGIFGAGAWGRNHVRTAAQLPDYAEVLVYDSAEDVRTRVAQLFPHVRVLDDPGLMMEAVDAVVVATPAAAHAGLVREGIAAGKPVLVEKPFTLAHADAVALERSSTEAGVPILVGHLLLFHPAVERLRELVGGGAVGEVYYLHSQRVNLGQVRPDENALWSFGPHDISVALHLVEDAPVRVTAHGKDYLQRGIEDVVFVTLEFGSGTLAHMHLSWLDPHKRRVTTVVGSKQMVVFDDMEPREKLRIYDKGVERPPAYGSYGESLSVREGDIAIPKIPNTEPLAAELRHFAAIVRDGATPRVPAADGTAVVRILEAADASLRAGGVPISLEG